MFLSRSSQGPFLFVCLFVFSCVFFVFVLFCFFGVFFFFLFLFLFLFFCFVLFLLMLFFLFVLSCEALRICYELASQKRHLSSRWLTHTSLPWLTGWVIDFVHRLFGLTASRPDTLLCGWQSLTIQVLHNYTSVWLTGYNNPSTTKLYLSARVWCNLSL